MTRLTTAETKGIHLFWSLCAAVTLKSDLNTKHMGWHARENQEDKVFSLYLSLTVSHSLCRALSFLWRTPFVHNPSSLVVPRREPQHFTKPWYRGSRLSLRRACSRSDRPATEIDVAQIENRGRMAIMSRQEKHVSVSGNTKGLSPYCYRSQ